MRRPSPQVARAAIRHPLTSTIKPDATAQAICAKSTSTAPISKATPSGSTTQEAENLRRTFMDNKSYTTRSSKLHDFYRQHQEIASTFLATILACIVLLSLLGHKPLTNWDEGIYAEISREMLSLGILIPHWNYQPWFEKPPLMLQITAAFFKIFG